MNYLILTLVVLNLSSNFTDINTINIETELECLTKNIYFEARGEVEEGQTAVAQVTLERVRSKTYPNTICGVVKDPGQFSWLWDKKSDIMTNEKAKKQAYSIAVDTLLGKYQNKVVGAQSYHNTSVKPYWTKSMVKVAQINNHIFYKKRK